MPPLSRNLRRNGYGSDLVSGQGKLYGSRDSIAGRMGLSPSVLPPKKGDPPENRKRAQMPDLCVVDVTCIWGLDGHQPLLEFQTQGSPVQVCVKCVWLKVKELGLRRFESLVPFTRVPFWYMF